MARRLLWLEALLICVVYALVPVGSRAETRTSRDVLDGIEAEMFSLEMGSSYVVKIVAGTRAALVSGTGFVFQDGGVWYIATNNHSISHAVTAVWVQFYGRGGYHKVRVIGRDPLLDVALLEVPMPTPRDVVPAVLGRSRDLRIGNRVYAVGYPYGKRGVSIGWVNGLGSPLSSYFVSTQAPLHPGNSGGPLIRFRDAVPEIIGMNTAIATKGLLSMSLRIEYLQRVLPRLQAEKVVQHATSGFAVMDIDVIPPPLFEQATDTPYTARGTVCAGAFVYDVEPGSSAARSGVRKGDCLRSLILAEREVPLLTAELFDDLIFFDFRSGDKIVVNMTRGGQELVREITLGILETGPLGKSGE